MNQALGDEGTGVICGNVLNSSQINLGGEQAAGRLRITGDYTQSASGSQDVDLGGITPVTEFDVLEVSGTASLGGVLNVLALNGFVPVVPDVFEILSFGVGSGDFASVTQNGFGAASLIPMVDGVSYRLEAE